MKKVLFVAVIALASVMAYAQPRAIGARFGGFEGVSYQHSLGEDNMIEIELGFGMGGYVNSSTKANRTELGYIKDNKLTYSYTGNVIEAAFTYDWINPFDKTIPWDKKGKWNWYLGVGAAGGYGWKADMKIVDDEGDRWYYTWYSNYTVKNWGFIGAAGRVGVEYEFWFPLVISADFRPTLGVGLAENPVYTDYATYNYHHYSQEALNKAFDKVIAGFYWDIFNVAISARYKF